MTDPVFIWDIGRVLIGYDPQCAYLSSSRLTGTALEWWVDKIIAGGFAHSMDEGLSAEEAIARSSADFIRQYPDRVVTYPDHADLLRHYCTHFLDTLDDSLAETRQIRDAYRACGHRTYALTNFSDEFWPRAVARFPWLEQGFDGILVSGQDKLAKPDPRIFERLFARYQINPHSAIFIDDRADNCATARSLGLTAFQFTTPAALCTELSAHGL